jgi:hypothetical protein
MNIGARRTAATLAVTLCGFFLGGLTHVHVRNPPVAAVAKPADPVETQVHARAETIIVDTLVVSHALKASAGVNAASRVVKLNIAWEHIRAASATASTLPAATRVGAGTTSVNVREDLTRTLKALGVEVATMIACESVKTPACNSPATVTRQSQAGAAAGAAVVKLMQAAHVDQQFVAAASSTIQKDLATPGRSTLHTRTLRAEALAGLRPDR